MKTYLFVLRKPAHSGAYVQEMLDIILTTAAFDQPVSVLWLDDGVFQLKQGQQPDSAGYKDTAATFHALALYDVNEFYVEAESLTERGLSPTDLLLPVTLLPRFGLAAWLKKFAVIFPG